LIPQLEATRVEIRDVRFGIVSSEPTDVFEEGAILEITGKPITSGTILLSMPDTGKQLRLDGEVYLPQSIGFEPERQYLKARFSVPFIDFVFWPYQAGRAKLHYELPDPNEEYSLSRSNFVSIRHLRT
jgi:hypothetical protein